MKNVVTRLVSPADANRADAGSDPQAAVAAATGYLNRHCEARLCNEAVPGLSSPLEHQAAVDAVPGRHLCHLHARRIAFG